MDASASAGAMPTVHEMTAPAAWRAIDFISDLHLAADMPLTFAAWADYMGRTRADVVFILGDLFEVWAGDDARDDEFERRCVDVLARAARQRAIGFMAGNRDFLVGASMLDACGLFALPDPTVLVAFGERVLLTHGDALCLSDVAYQQFRSQVRSAAWQADFLARPLDERRALARRLRDGSEQRKRQMAAHDWPDIDPAATLRWMDAAGAPTLIHGHTHRPASGPIAPGRVRHVLSDWDLEQPPARAEVLRLSAGGLRRLSPTAASTTGA
jgi:UDP-2,3-diacylglucosamine hydrolase